MKRSLAVLVIICLGSPVAVLAADIRLAELVVVGRTNETQDLACHESKARFRHLDTAFQDQCSAIDIEVKNALPIVEDRESHARAKLGLLKLKARFVMGLAPTIDIDDFARTQKRAIENEGSVEAVAFKHAMLNTGSGRLFYLSAIAKDNLIGSDPSERRFLNKFIREVETFRKSLKAISVGGTPTLSEIKAMQKSFTSLLEGVAGKPSALEQFADFIQTKSLAESHSLARQDVNTILQVAEILADKRPELVRLELAIRCRGRLYGLRHELYGINSSCKLRDRKTFSAAFKRHSTCTAAGDSSPLTPPTASLVKQLERVWDFR